MGKTQNKSKSDFVLIVKLKVSKTWLQVLCASKLSRYQREKITTIFVCQGETKSKFRKLLKSCLARYSMEDRVNANLIDVLQPIPANWFNLEWTSVFSKLILSTLHEDNSFL